jgi:hypothetical protein
MKRFLIATAVLLAIAIIVPAVSFASYKLSFHRRLHGKARREWKQAAVSDIVRKAANSAWLSNEIATLSVQTKDTNHMAEDSWFSGHLILTRSGEWMLYTNICTKSNARVHDLFIGLGSDGKWYYSSYHFCIEMVVLRMNPELEGQPENLRKFVWAYYLRTFDRRSGDCLQETWNWKLWRPRAASPSSSGP